MMQVDREPYSLREMIQHFVSHSFNDLRNTLEEQIDDNNGPNLMSVLNAIYINAAKVLIMFKFNKNYPNSDKVVNYLNAYKKINEFIRNYTWQLTTLYNTKLDSLRNPMYDVLGAVDTIVGQGVSRLPLSIFPKLAEPHFDGNQDKMVEAISMKLIAFFTTQIVPHGIRIDVKDGVAVVTYLNQYKISFTFNSSDDTPVCCGVDILLPYVIKGNAMARYDEKKQGIFVIPNTDLKMKEILTGILKSDEHDKFMKVHEKACYFVKVFEFDKLCTEASSIAQSRGISVSWGPGIIRTVFWKIIPTVFDIVLDKHDIILVYENKRIDCVSGRSYEEILAECMRIRASARLKTFLQQIGGGVIKEINSLPVILLSGITIYIDKYTGKYMVKEDPKLADEFTDIEKIQNLVRHLNVKQECKMKHEESFTEDW